MLSALRWMKVERCVTMRMDFLFMATESGKAWFVPPYRQAIMEADLDSGECRSLVRLGSLGMSGANMWGPIQKNGDYLAVAPIRGENFFLYNLRTEKLKSLPVDGLGSEKNYRRTKFWFSFCRRESIYFTGPYPWIVRIDADNERIEVIKIRLSDGKGADFGMDVDVFGKAAAIRGNEVYIPLSRGRGAVVFDYERRTYRTKEIGCCSSAVCGDGHFLCLIPNTNGNIGIYDLRHDSLLADIRLPAGIDGLENGRWYCAALYHGGYVWVMPCHSNMILRLDLSTREAVCVKKFHNAADIKYLNAGIYDEDRIWGVYYGKKSLDIIDCRSMQTESKVFYLPNSSLYIEERDIGQILTEKSIPLEKLIPYIGRPAIGRPREREKWYVGRSIWERLR